MAPSILTVGTSLPNHVHSQSEVTEVLSNRLATTPKTKAVLDRIHQATGVNQRHFVMPISEYESIDSFSQSNSLFVEHALSLTEQATKKALSDAGISAEDVDHMFFTTVTGLGAPAVDVLLSSRMGFRSDLRRVPSFGLGCVGGAAGISRVADYLAGHPTGVALVVSVEICSLTIQWQDKSMANFVGTGLFGDGAATVVMVGDKHPLAKNGIKVSSTKSSLFPDTEQMIGWKIGTSGFLLMLEAGVPDMVEKHFASDVEKLLSENGLTKDDINVWIAHPGGPRILDAFSSSLELDRTDLETSWEVMSRVGNLSSAGVLHVLSMTPTQPSGTRGLLFALGPGVSSEIVLLEWS